MHMQFYTKKSQASRERGTVPLLQAAAFWPVASESRKINGAIYRGLIFFYANRQLRQEAEIRDREGKGLGALVKATHRRLAAMENGRGRYTETHSREAMTSAGTIMIEAIQRDHPEARGADPAWSIAGGYCHDIGKTVMPQALLSKECGIEIFGLRLLMGVKLSVVERSVLREHVRFGSDMGRIYLPGQDAESISAQDMIDSHHVNYNGLDSAYPSYPPHRCGMRLSLHARIAKTADFILRCGRGRTSRTTSSSG